MVLTKQRYTFNDWLTVPDDGRRYELLHGEPVEMAAPTNNHGELAEELYMWLRQAQSAGYGRARLGPVAVLLDPQQRRENALNPDVFFIRAGREGISKADAIEGVPDLIIEILSPTTRDRDLPAGEKWRMYEGFGVPFYWLVDPELRTVRQYVLSGGRFTESATLRAGQSLTSPLFPGGSLSVADLFSVMHEPG
jgi:Uma2 family endonuclease